MPVSFDDTFTIYGSGDIDPQGPLDDLAGRGMTNDGNNKVHIHFWVTQQQSGTSGAFMQGQAMLDTANTTRWKTTTLQPIHRHGPFQPGAAFAQGVAIVDPN